MSYKIKGEMEVEVGLGLPRYSSIEREAYTPSNVGYKVYDTDHEIEYTWAGDRWIGGVEIFKQIPFSFQDVLPENEVVVGLAVVRSFTILQQTVLSADGDCRGFALTAPTGGNGYLYIKRNNLQIGTIEFTANTNSAKFQFPNNVTFLPGDELLIESGTQNGTANCFITLKVLDPDRGLAAGQENTTLYVSKSGDTLTGPLELAADPVLPLEAATKQYVDQTSFQTNFVVNEWGFDNQNALTITQATHGIPYSVGEVLMVQVLERNGNTARQVSIETSVNIANGNVKLSTAGQPFDGTVIITKQ